MGTLTVPLQMVEFFLILSAADPNISGGMFWRLLIGTVVMLAFGYMGEENWCNPWTGFVVGMCGWVFILGEIFVGPCQGRLHWCTRVREVRFRCHALHRHYRLVHLPPGLLLRLPLQRRRSLLSQPHLQLGGLREQDCVLLGHLARRQDGDPRQGHWPQGAAKPLNDRRSVSNGCRHIV